MFYSRLTNKMHVQHQRLCLTHHFFQPGCIQAVFLYNALFTQCAIHESQWISGTVHQRKT